MASAEQDQWTEICAAFRAQLARIIPLMPAMNPGEIGTMASAINEGMWCEIRAQSYDGAVEEHKRTLERQAQFGG